MSANKMLVKCVKCGTIFEKVNESLIIPLYSYQDQMKAIECNNLGHTENDLIPINELKEV